MRDKTGYTSDFSEVIENRRYSIELLISKVSSTQNIDKVLFGIYNAYEIMYNASYSSGTGKEDMQTLLSEVISAFSNLVKVDKERVNFEDTLLGLVSLTYLCDVEEEKFKLITDTIQNLSVKDKLLDYIIKAKQPDWQGDSRSFKQDIPYAALDSVIDETSEEMGIRALEDYLKNKWYQGHKRCDTAWVDSHLNKYKNVYAGYWAWETAAIVKIKCWNDERLKELKYYPYDAVHW